MKVVSLLASATEMINALGCLDYLVGRSHECDYPPEVQKLPLISNVQIDINTSSAQIDAQIKELARTKETIHNGALNALSIYAIDTEQLQALQPDIIFTQTQCEVCAVSEQDVVQALQKITGLQPQIVSLAPYRLEDVWEDIQRVGKALHQQERAEQLIQEYRARLERLKNKAEALGRQKQISKPRVAVLEWLDPLMAAGNWTPELIQFAGGDSTFGRVGEHSPWLNWEELEQADPDIIILSPCGFSRERTKKDLALLQVHENWSKLRAVKQGKIYIVDGNFYLNRSGPRLVDSAELLGRIIWGEELGIAVDEQAWEKISA